MKGHSLTKRHIAPNHHHHHHHTIPFPPRSSLI